MGLLQAAVRGPERAVREGLRHTRLGEPHLRRPQRGRGRVRRHPATVGQLPGRLWQPAETGNATVLNDLILLTAFLYVRVELHPGVHRGRVRPGGRRWPAGAALGTVGRV